MFCNIRFPEDKKMAKRIDKIIEAFETEYPDSICSLVYAKDYELLFATRLAAQCTDERVNKIAPPLFERFPSLESLAEADVEEIEDYIKSCGFYHTKARDISECAKVLVERHGGKVPDTMEELIALPGVGRKTANLILGDVYNKPAVVVDTHCIRLSNRIGLVDSKNPQKIETELRSILPPEKSNDFCHRLVLHGRAICKARKPTCERCCIKDCCAQNI